MYCNADFTLCVCGLMFAAIDLINVNCVLIVGNPNQLGQ